MSKVIAVTGATGSQGGGVVNVMKKTPGWKVRAITRNVDSDSARKLAADGVEVVAASFDDEDSLLKAFEGVYAVFAVTNWWEHLFSGKSQDEAGVLEEEQGMKIARAAARTTTLEHYIWSTCPSAKKILKGDNVAPHMDYKANVDDRIKSELPELAKKTTYLMFGYYPQNLAFFPLLKPIAYESGYANVALEKWTFQEMADVWSQVTGKKCSFVQCSPEDWTALWGPAGHELGLQFKFGELCDPWQETDEHISAEELGIDVNEVVGFKGTIEGLKHLF
ncbi:uncharacterized protein JN550_006471 [Neoarthrinium moseri]|uniref:uncharacterized protein n=1 Tax=Neoarthrinium moseri TaxID=1658444 RepID=UPI001FDD953E|nr:uncharacterized protein JN550_006471 [Neoarthrinium moseri]KAI1868555.1 hypothetical protein JN550_006471 [Neoarthrinium moseri]